MVPGAPAHGQGADDGRGRRHGGRRGRIVPRGKLGVQQWSIRDSITRLDESVSGYLGGPDFPADPTDLGALVPLPGGFASVFDYLASVGYRGFEFYSFDQGANGAITSQGIRRALERRTGGGGDAHGRPAADDRPRLSRAQIEMAAVLGYRMIGTAGNPATPTTGRWRTGRATPAGEQGRRGAAGRRHQVLLPPEQDWFRFFDDAAHPELAACTGSTGSPTTPTPARVLRAGHDAHPRRPGPLRRIRSTARCSTSTRWYRRPRRQRRLIAWHIKDADRIPLPAAGH